MSKKTTTGPALRKELWTTPTNRPGERRRLCYSPELNREIGKSHAKDLEKELGDVWLEEEPAKIYFAENVESNMGRFIQLLDINGFEIPPEDFPMYHLVIDGQHRSWQWADMMSTREPSEAILEIPSVHITLLPGETLVQYLVKINKRKNWELSQYIKTAKNLSPGNEVLSRYYTLLKPSDSRSLMVEGKYSMTALNLIYYGNPRAIDKGKAEKIMNGLLPVPTQGLSLKRGDRFIEITGEKFKGYYSGGKELALGFNDLRNELGNDEAAFKVLESLTPLDISKMMVVKKSKTLIDKDKVWQVLQEVSGRVHISPSHLHPSE